MKLRNTGRLWLHATALTVGMLMLWLLLDYFFNGNVWRDMTISRSAVTVEYCEFNHPDRLFHQPINTYSNLAYFFFGSLILLIARRDFRQRNVRPQNRMAGFPLLSALMGSCFLYLSLGSAFFHASMTYAGQRVDMNGTYSILLTLVGITFYHVFHRLTLSPAAQRNWVLAIVAVIGLFLVIAPRVPSSKLVPALILLLNGGMIVNYIQYRKTRSLLLILLSLALVLLAIRIRTLDVQKVNCDPYSLWQGHALWHLLTATSSFCSYAFYRFAGNWNPFATRPAAD